MNTWKDLAAIFQKELLSLYDEMEIEALFYMALEHISQRTRTDFLLKKEESCDVVQWKQFLTLLDGLKESRPIQHLLGYADFYGLKLHVNEHTLIPRPETEELVDLLLKKSGHHHPLKVIDIGTGSGCIPIALAKYMPTAEVWAVEISKEALDVAQQNACEQQVAVQFINADILEWEYLFPNGEKFDVVVSNPPYICPNEKKNMHKNVLAHEPHSALFVEESAPLLFYDHIADFALMHLKNGGMLYFEINQYLGAETALLIQKKGFLHVQIVKDINGADRIITAKKSLGRSSSPIKQFFFN